MSNYIEVIAIVEGKTEQFFVERILAPYLGQKNIGMRATQVSKPGQKGGDVRFTRAKRDLELHLKQRPDTYVTTFIDYFGTKEWPGLDLVLPEAINNNPLTAPSKRLDTWSPNGKFLKTTMGITIAKDIGIEKIRNECPLFNEWLKIFEEIQRSGQ